MGCGLRTLSRRFPCCRRRSGSRISLAPNWPLLVRWERSWVRLAKPSPTGGRYIPARRSSNRLRYNGRPRRFCRTRGPALSDRCRRSRHGSGSASRAEAMPGALSRLGQSTLWSSLRSRDSGPVTHGRRRRGCYGNVRSLACAGRGRSVCSLSALYSLISRRERVMRLDHFPDRSRLLFKGMRLRGRRVPRKEMLRARCFDG